MLPAAHQEREGVFRIVSAELAVMDNAAHVAELVVVRLNAADQKCDAVPPKLRAVLP